MDIVSFGEYLTTDRSVDPGTLFQAHYGSSGMSNYLKVATPEEYQKIWVVDLNDPRGRPHFCGLDTFSDETGIALPNAAFIGDGITEVSSISRNYIGCLLLTNDGWLIYAAGDSATSPGHLVNIESGEKVSSPSGRIGLCRSWSVYPLNPFDTEMDVAPIASFTLNGNS